MNLPMNLNDIDLWEKELLKGFALPLGFLPEIGEVVNILEPFKRLTIFEPVEKDGETTEKKVTVGIIYRSDAYMLGITAELYPTNMTRLSNGVQPASSRNMPFGVRLLSPSSSTSRFDPLPLMTSNFFGWTMLHKMIPSFLWRNICPSRTLSCCMAGGSSTIKRP